MLTTNTITAAATPLINATCFCVRDITESDCSVAAVAVAVTAGTIAVGVVVIVAVYIRFVGVCICAGRVSVVSAVVSGRDMLIDEGASSAGRICRRSSGAGHWQACADESIVLG